MPSLIWKQRVTNWLLLITSSIIFLINSVMEVFQIKLSLSVAHHHYSFETSETFSLLSHFTLIKTGDRSTDIILPSTLCFGLCLVSSSCPGCVKMSISCYFFLLLISVVQNFTQLFSLPCSIYISGQGFTRLLRNIFLKRRVKEKLNK